jgi:hypothetical protein
MTRPSRLAAALLALAALTPAAPAADLAADFRSPPPAARPHTWWHWMDGNVTREGITKDLEAMRAVGIGGVQIFDVSYEIPRGPVDYAGPEWRRLLQFAEQEADRLGLEVCLHNCSGWSSTGGPWVTPDRAMQTVVTAETPLAGGGRRTIALPAPAVPAYAAYYHDIAVLACKTPAADRTSLAAAHPEVTSTLPAINTAAFARTRDGLDLTFTGPTAGHPVSFLFSFDGPFTARTLYLKTSSRLTYQAELQASNDGQTFKPVTSTSLRLDRAASLPFAPVAAKYFRLQFTTDAKDPDPITLDGFDLTPGYRLPDWPMKANVADMRQYAPSWEDTAPPDSTYSRTDIVDVTSSFDAAAGTLTWEAPPGDWTILRVGYAPSGRQNRPATPAGVGLEIDKMSRPAVDLHFAKLLDLLLADAGPRAGRDKTVTTLLVDSYETGPQNWTPGFREEFKKRRGYDLLPFLPTFTGRVVDSPAVTERFLFDLRTTVAELFKENYFEYFRDQCHRRGILTAIEPYDGPFDTLDVGALADLPMSEFWNRRPADSSRSRYVVSAAHYAGRPVIGAEAFTSSLSEDKYTADPFSMKAIGDAYFCEGINRLIFHRYAHQPWADGPLPGMTMGPWGAHLERSVTWWNQGRGWMEYLARCQYLLQAGKPVADVLCFSGEDQRIHARWNNSETPPLPPGVDYEFASTAMLQSARVDGGKIVLPNGMPFAALLLPDARGMTPTTLAAIDRLAAAGATVVGPPPRHNASLQNAPAADAAFTAAVAALWGDADGKAVTRHARGSGQVFWGAPIKDVLAAVQVSPDFTYTGRDVQSRLLFKHRALSEGDAYFVSNQRNAPDDALCSFRVTGKAPELWHPDTGAIEPAPLYRDADGRTAVPLHLDPGGSVFVLFRTTAAADHAIAIDADTSTPPTPPQVAWTARDGTYTVHSAVPGTFDVTLASGKKLRASVGPVPAPITVPGPWQVAFQPNRGAPANATFDRLTSWTTHDNPGIRYFSGTATYTAQVDVPAPLLAPGNDVSLDLGDVKNLAEVSVNGKDLGLLWKPPFRTAATAALHPGQNSLEIRVTNTWANRLIGDEQFPDDAAWVPSPQRGGFALKEWPDWLQKGLPRPSPRIAFVTWKLYDKDAPLLPSGLLGPVTLTAAVTAEAK